MYFHLYITVWKCAKSDSNHAYLYIKFYNSIWFFHFMEHKLITNEDVGTKLCTKNSFGVCHLMSKNCQNRNMTFQHLGYRICGSSADMWPFPLNIGMLLKFGVNIVLIILVPGVEDGYSGKYLFLNLYVLIRIFKLALDLYLIYLSICEVL